MTWSSMAMAAAGLTMGMAATVTDLSRRSVPNWLTVPAIAAGLLCHTALAGWRGLGVAAGGAALGFALLLPLHLKGVMGGGDVKLMAAFGALLGPPGILLSALLGSVFGGVWAMAWLACKPGSAAVPYAPAIVLGACMAWLGGGS